jgi:hypothetical protein
MLFAVGVFLGCVAGLAAAMALGVGGRSVFNRQAVPMIVSLVALVVGGVALVESTRSQGHETPAGLPVVSTVPATTSTTSVPAAAPDGAAGAGVVRVPSVRGLTEATALSLLQKAGLQSNVDAIPLANVPAGYVITQSPLPESTAPPGTTVNLQVSARA